MGNHHPEVTAGALDFNKGETDMPSLHEQQAAIWAEAVVAGNAAAKAHDATLGPENLRGLDCGFAWVVIHPARGPFVEWAKREGIGETRTYGDRGFQIWYSKFSNVPTQSIGTHEAAARAVVEVLKRHDINASSASRLD